MTTPTKTKLFVGLTACLALAALSSARTAGQSQPSAVDQARLLKPLADHWTSYSGDYTGKRYSALTQINQSNVKNLGLAWSTRIQPGIPAGAGGRGAGFGTGPSFPTIIGGEGTGALNESGGRSARIVGSILAVDGVLYATTPDHGFAIDARDGRLLWKYVRRHTHREPWLRHVGALPLHDHTR